MAPLHSSVCTGGSREALVCGETLACGEGAACGEGVAFGEAGPDWIAGLVSVACTCAREGAARRAAEWERRKPQECAIEGPAA